MYIKNVFQQVKQFLASLHSQIKKNILQVYSVTLQTFVFIFCRLLHMLTSNPMKNSEKRTQQKVFCRKACLTVIEMDKSFTFHTYFLRIKEFYVPLALFKTLKPHSQENTQNIEKRILQKWLRIILYTYSRVYSCETL